MKCQKCQKQNKKSRVYPDGFSTVTAMYCSPFYDEEGVYHNHDSNSRTQRYTCSNNHVWEVTSSGNCHCGWSGGEKSVKWLPDIEPTKVCDIDISGSGTLATNQITDLTDGGTLI